MGFELIETRTCAGYFGLKEELPALFSFISRLPGEWRIKKYIKQADWKNHFGHIMVFVCRKPCEEEAIK
jgi:hypothetical protein